MPINNWDMQEIDSRLSEYAKDSEEFWTEISSRVTSKLEDSWRNRSTVDNLIIPFVEITARESEFLLYKLAIVSWYIDTDLGFFIRDAIYPKVQKDPRLIHVRFSLTSKSLMLKVLEDELSTRTSRQVYGNFLNTKEWNADFFASVLEVKFRKEYNPMSDYRPVAEKRTVAVGYNDKGNLPKSWKPGIEAYQDNLLYIEKIKEQKAYDSLEESYWERLLG